MHDRQAEHITVTSLDAHRLRRLLDAAADSLDHEHFEGLEEGLDAARVVDPGSIAADIVTLDSRVRIRDLKTGEESTYTLVMPRESNMASGAVAITAPLGRAMFGRKRGDRVQFKTPGGLRRVRVMEVLYQPEAEGASRVDRTGVPEEGLL